MSARTKKVLFLLSFLPYVAVLLYGVVGGIVAAVSGVNFLFGKAYGFNAFFLHFFLTFYVFIGRIPVIPVFAIFHICYYLRTHVERFRWVSLKKFVIVCSVVGCLLVGLILKGGYGQELSAMRFSREQDKQKAAAEQMIENAEEKIGFNEQTIHGGGILGIPGYLNSHILVDYDTSEVGMLIGEGTSAFWKVEMKQTSKDSTDYQQIITAYVMQADISLSSPGKRLVTFCKADEPHRTTAMLLFYEDGTVYCSGRIEEADGYVGKFTGLNWSNYYVGEGKRFKEE